MTEPAPKRLYIKTYGCQMNVYDSERVADVLRPLGYGMTARPEGADLVVLNTCHIREKATEKVYSELGKLKELRQARTDAGGDTGGTSALVLEAEELRAAYRALQEVYDQYTAQYLRYWSRTVFEEAAPAPFASAVRAVGDRPAGPPPDPRRAGGA